MTRVFFLAGLLHVTYCGPSRHIHDVAFFRLMKIDAKVRVAAEFVVGNHPCMRQQLAALKHQLKSQFARRTMLDGGGPDRQRKLTQSC